MTGLMKAIHGNPQNPRDIEGSLKQEVSDLLVNFRTEHGLTQLEMANFLEIKFTDYLQLEGGHYKKDYVGILSDIVSKFGKEVHLLLSDTEIADPPDVDEDDEDGDEDLEEDDDEEEEDYIDDEDDDEEDDDEDDDEDDEDEDEDTDDEDDVDDDFDDEEDEDFGDLDDEDDDEDDEDEDEDTDDEDD